MEHLTTDTLQHIAHATGCYKLFLSRTCKKFHDLLPITDKKLSSLWQDSQFGYNPRIIKELLDNVDVYICVTGECQSFYEWMEHDIAWNGGLCIVDVKNNKLGNHDDISGTVTFILGGDAYRYDIFNFHRGILDEAQWIMKNAGKNIMIVVKMDYADELNKRRVKTIMSDEFMASQRKVAYGIADATSRLFRRHPTYSLNDFPSLKYLLNFRQNYQRI